MTYILQVVMLNWVYKLAFQGIRCGLSFNEDGWRGAGEQSTMEKQIYTKRKRDFKYREWWIVASRDVRMNHSFIDSAQDMRMNHPLIRSPIMSQINHILNPDPIINSVPRHVDKSPPQSWPDHRFRPRHADELPLWSWSDHRFCLKYADESSLWSWLITDSKDRSCS